VDVRGDRGGEHGDGEPVEPGTAGEDESGAGRDVHLGSPRIGGDRRESAVLRLAGCGKSPVER
jgi:hypothetical protein